MPRRATRVVAGAFETRLMSMSATIVGRLARNELLVVFIDMASSDSPMIVIQLLLLSLPPWC